MMSGSIFNCTFSRFTSKSLPYSFHGSRHRVRLSRGRIFQQPLDFSDFVHGRLVKPLLCSCVTSTSNSLKN